MSQKGVNLHDLIDMAERIGLIGRPLRVEMQDLQRLKTPAVLHWNLDHFFVLKKVSRNRVLLHDPALGEIRVSLSECAKHFSGVVLELTPGVSFHQKKPAPTIRLGELIGKIEGLKRGLLQLFALAIVLEVFSLTTPILRQWIMDEAIGGSDPDLVKIICVGILGVALVTTAINTLREWISIYVSTHFNLIGTAVKALQITRIIIAHRPETIALADRVLVIKNKRVVEVEPNARPLSLNKVADLGLDNSAPANRAEAGLELVGSVHAVPALAQGHNPTQTIFSTAGRVDKNGWVKYGGIRVMPGTVTLTIAAAGQAQAHLGRDYWPGTGRFEARTESNVCQLKVERSALLYIGVRGESKNCKYELVLGFEKAIEHVGLAAVEGV